MGCSTSARGPVCAAPGCGKPTWNGKPHEYCSKRCRAKACPTCIAPGCRRPTWNREPDEFCSQRCRDTKCATCLAPDCNRPTWNGHRGEFCSQACRDLYSLVVGMDGMEYTPGNGAPVIQPLTTGRVFENVMGQLSVAWDTANKGPLPHVTGLYKITVTGDVWERYRRKQKDIEAANPGRHGASSGEGNENRRWHGTRMMCDFRGTLCEEPACALCRIIEDGHFDLSKIGCNTGNRGFYGEGYYFTSKPCTAKGYGLRPGMQPPPHSFADFVAPDAGNALLLCRVLVGNAEVREVHAPGPCAGWYGTTVSAPYHSRIVNKKFGAFVDELVLFEEDQALPMFLITMSRYDVVCA